MNFRKSFSKPFKKLKDKLPGGSRKEDGSEDGRKGSEAGLKGDKVSQRNPYLRSEVSVEGTVQSAEGSNVGGKKDDLVDADPPTSTPPISHIEEPDGM